MRPDDNTGHDQWEYQADKKQVIYSRGFCASSCLSVIPSTKLSDLRKWVLDPDYLGSNPASRSRYTGKLRPLFPTYFNTIASLTGVLWGLRNEWMCAKYIAECLVHRRGSINVNRYHFVASSLSLLWNAKSSLGANRVHRNFNFHWILNIHTCTHTQAHKHTHINTPQ